MANIVVGESIDTSAAISGVITVTTAGTAVQGPNVKLTNGVYVRALKATTLAYVGNDGAGDVASTNGYELQGGESVVVQVGNLNQLWFDAAVNGEKLCWLKA